MWCISYMSSRTEVVIVHESGGAVEAVRADLELGGKKTRFSITLGDITEAKVDAIVCPANPGFEYAGFGGVQVAIAGKSGMGTFEEAEAKAKAATSPGKLRHLKSIIHVNNMRVDQDPPCDESVVRTCTASVLAEADRIGLASVAIPALGTEFGG